MVDVVLGGILFLSLCFFFRSVFYDISLLFRPQHFRKQIQRSEPLADAVVVCVICGIYYYFTLSVSTTKRFNIFAVAS